MKEKYCGECCWFYAEDTDGNGLCPLCFGDVMNCGYVCDKPNMYVSKAYMRHHMAVLLKIHMFATQKQPDTHKLPNLSEANKAAQFAYLYMKVFSEL